MPTPPSATKMVMNKAQFDAAVKNTAIKTIKLGDSITGNLSVDRLVSIDLNGKTVTGDVAISTTATGTIDITAGTITGNLTVTAPDATINNSATVNGTVTINDVAVGTWNENADNNKFVINDKTGVIFNVKPGKKVAKIEVTADATGAIQINNEGIITELEANSEVTLVNEQGATVTTVSGTKDVEINGGGAENVDPEYQALKNAKAKVDALVNATTDKSLTEESNLIAAETALAEAQTALQAIENNTSTEGLFNETAGRQVTIETAREAFNLEAAKNAVSTHAFSKIELDLEGGKKSKADVLKTAVEALVDNGINVSVADDNVTLSIGNLNEVVTLADLSYDTDIHVTQATYKDYETNLGKTIVLGIDKNRSIEVLPVGTKVSVFAANGKSLGAGLGINTLRLETDITRAGNSDAWGLSTTLLYNKDPQGRYAWNSQVLSAFTSEAVPGFVKIEYVKGGITFSKVVALSAQQQ